MSCKAHDPAIRIGLLNGTLSRWGARVRPYQQDRWSLLVERDIRATAGLEAARWHAYRINKLHGCSQSKVEIDEDFSTSEA
jgi:hypothetical protein